MKLQFAGCSRTGLVREHNEDACLMRASRDAALFLVADGIGGRAHGEVASGLLRDGYDAWWRERFLPGEGTLSFQAALEEIKETLSAQNRAVFQQFGPMQAGSTLVLLFLFRGNCLYLSSGDSRIYRSRGLSLRQVTVDDVYENLTDPPGGGTDRKQYGKLVGAVGLRAAPEFTLRTEELRRGTVFFLCSDGVYRYLDARRLAGQLRNPFRAPEQVIESIAAEVERGGAGDNYSMIYARVNGV